MIEGYITPSSSRVAGGTVTGEVIFGLIASVAGLAIVRGASINPISMAVCAFDFSMHTH
jgi:hypothetical protein